MKLKAINYIENNITNNISIDDVSDKIYASSSNFGRIFNLVMGMTIGDYIRSRRLSFAGQELLQQKMVKNGQPMKFLALSATKMVVNVFIVYQRKLQILYRLH